MLSKYGNIPTYLFPIDPKDTDSFLHSADFIEVSTNEATTGNGDKIYNGAGWDVHALRNAISWWLLNRGQVRPLAVQMYAPTHNIVYFFDTESQAKALGPLATYLNNPKNSGTKVKAFRPMYCYSSRDSTTDSKRQELIEKYQTILNFKSDWNNLATGLWMLELGRTKTGREQGKDWMARVIYAFHPTLANTQPIAVVFSSSEVNEVVLAAAMVALEFGSPVIVFDEEEKVENNNLLTESAKRKMIKMKRVLIEMADFVGKSHMEITNYCDAIVKKIST